MKPLDNETGLHLVGVEDGSFEAFKRDKTLFAFLCSIKLESDFLRLIRLSRIQVDGIDATKKLLDMLRNVKADAIILGGITFAGFNIIDPQKIFDGTGVPVIVCSGKKPDNVKMLRALKNHFDDWRVRWEIVSALGPVHSVETYLGEPPIYFEVVGGSPKWAKVVLCKSATISRIPEPVRVAGIIARGLSPAS